MSKTLVLVNTLNTINAFIYANHCQFWAKTIRDNTGDDFLFQTPYRMSIDMARNLAAKQAIELDFDYLMFIDDDVMVPNDAYTKLKAADKDVVAGLGLIRGFPFDVMAFKETFREEKITKEDGTEITLNHKELTYYNDIDTSVELVPCGAIGFSCCLIKVDVLKALKPPYFVTLPHCTEDVFFCNRIKDELSPEPEIYTHTGVQWGHMLNSEPVEWGTKKKFQDFYSEWAIENAAKSMELANVPDRDLSYITKVLGRM